MCTVEKKSRNTQTILLHTVFIMFKFIICSVNSLKKRKSQCCMQPFYSIRGFSLWFEIFATLFFTWVCKYDKIDFLHYIHKLLTSPECNGCWDTNSQWMLVACDAVDGRKNGNIFTSESKMEWRLSKTIQSLCETYEIHLKSLLKGYLQHFTKKIQVMYKLYVYENV